MLIVISPFNTQNVNKHKHEQKDIIAIERSYQRELLCTMNKFRVYARAKK
jgi:hypothetical protein